MTSVYEMTRDGPPNAGKLWTEDHEAMLLLLASSGMTVGEVAATMGRSNGGILARYCRLKGIVVTDNFDGLRSDRVLRDIRGMDSPSARRMYRGY
jgi:hypothetical protein